VASDFSKELFLERFVKEIIKPFQPEKTKKQDGNDSMPAQNTDSNAGYYHVMVGGKLVKKRRVSKDNHPNRTPKNDPNESGDVIHKKLNKKQRIWKESIVIGANQCLRHLENLNSDRKAATTIIGDNLETKPITRKPLLIVLTRDIYPPTMCCAIPALAKQLQIPLLLLPGKASLELGQALNAKRTSVLLFCAPPITSNDGASIEGGNCEQRRNTRNAISSFVSFIKDQVPGISEQ